VNVEMIIMAAKRWFSLFYTHPVIINSKVCRA